MKKVIYYAKRLFSIFKFTNSKNLQQPNILFKPKEHNVIEIKH